MLHFKLHLNLVIRTKIPKYYALNQVRLYFI
ncbi:hypothetical protein T09_5868 [Trichinella sp. T9]|nr:hypothetical protein T09_5868 [Trichinella sp. T9]